MPSASSSLKRVMSLGRLSRRRSNKSRVSGETLDGDDTDLMTSRSDTTLHSVLSVCSDVY